MTKRKLVPITLATLAAAGLFLLWRTPEPHTGAPSPDQPPAVEAASPMEVLPARSKSATNLTQPRRTQARQREETKTNQHVFDAETAEAALKAGLYLDEVREFANAMLAGNTDITSWNYGNIIYNAQSLLGRVALREGKLEEAKQALIEAGRTPGSPQLNSFGPEFDLARELLATNEFDTVLEFLDSVGTFWANPEQRAGTNAIWVATHNRQIFDSWTQQIRDHKIPNDPKWR